MLKVVASSTSAMSENHQKLYRPQCIVHTTLQNVLSPLDIVVWMEKGICEG